MSSINYASNLPKPAETPDIITTNFFNGYYDQQLTISKENYDVVQAFFLGETNNKDAADALTSMVITISSFNRINPMSIIENLRGLTGLNLTKTLTVLFNSTRRNSSYLGYTQVRQTNMFVMRNIVV